MELIRNLKHLVLKKVVNLVLLVFLQDMYRLRPHYGEIATVFNSRVNQNIDSFRDGVDGFFKSISRKTFIGDVFGGAIGRVNFPSVLRILSKPSEK